jgi:mannose-6-phosphate isomerase-like protein (cupin superfamily)
MSTSIPKTLDSFTETWSPRLVASVNDQHVKIAKCDGSFLFHSHPDSDELFYLFSGKLTMEIEGGDDVVMKPGDVYVVPKGVRHRPVCENAEIMMVEKAGTVNTGDEPAGERTRVPVEVMASS